MFSNIEGSLQNGINEIGSKVFHVDEIVTQGYGTCAKIMPMFSLNSTFVPYTVLLKLDGYFNLTEMRYSLFLTTNNSWQGICTSDWPQFSPSLVRMKSGQLYDFSVRPKKLLFKNGLKSSEQCWLEHIQRMKNEFDKRR